MSAKKLSKKEIKEDSFITATLRAWEYVKEHQNAFFLALVALIVIIVGITWMSHSRGKKQSEASSQLAEALVVFRAGRIADAENAFRTIADGYGNTREGVYAKYLAGKCALEDGRNSVAIKAFDEYLKASNRYPFFRDAAMDGKAVALENMQLYKEAAAVYLELVENMKTNEFSEALYLRRAADNLKLSDQKEKAIEILEKLKEKSIGLDRRNIEIEIDMLRG